MHITPNLIPSDNKEHLKKLSEPGVFEEKITDWMREHRDGSLTKEDILKVTQEVAQRRGDNSLVGEIKSRMWL